MSLKSTPLHLLVAAFAAVVVVSGCDKQPKVDDSKVIATVNGKAITEKAYEFFKSRIRQPVHPDPVKERELILEQMVNQQLLVDYAETNKIDQEEDVYLTMQRQRDTLLIGAAQRDILKKYPELTEEDVKARYDEEVKATHKTAYKVSHIVVEDEAAARSIIDELKKGGNFTELAKQNSKGPTASKGGDLGWVQQGMVVPEFFEALLKLKKGDYTAEPVNTQFGWHVIMVNDTRDVDLPPYDKVKADVARLIQQDRINDKVKELREQAKIDIKTVETPKAAEPDKAADTGKEADKTESK